MKQIYNVTQKLLLKGLTVLVIFAGLAIQATAQQYSNGPLSTGATTSNGTAAPAGFTWSEMNATNLNFGFGANIDAQLSVADNFTVPAGCGTWNVSKLTFYGYSSNYVGATSPFNRVFVKIFNTNPAVGNPTPIYGDFTTNRFAASSTASIYRIANASPGTARQVWKVEANVTINLNPGTYWIEWSLGTVAGVTSNFSPPVTIVGQPSPAGSNAKQHDIANNAWTDLGAAGQDAGPQDMPFLVDYTFGTAGSNATAPVISSVPSSTCAGSPITLNVIGGSLNGAAAWRWYTGSCGGTLVGTGNSITVSPGTTTTYYVRGEGGCAPAPGPCGQQTVTVTACTCLVPDVATICAGGVQQISLSAAALAPTTQTFSSGTINLAIPDGNPTGITTAPIAIPAGVTINSASNLRVSINATHTWVGDLIFRLTSPCGTTFLFDRPGVPAATFGNSMNLGGVYTFDVSAATIIPETSTGTTVAPGSYRPSDAAGAAHNWAGLTFPCAGTGNWTLTVSDNGAGDTGSLTDWSISVVNTATAVFSPTTGLFTDAGATVPYTGTAVTTVWAAPTGTQTYTANISSGPCAGNNTVTVTVLPRPTVAVTGGGCSPATLTATGATNYTWSPATGLNTTSGAVVTATVGTTTTYTVTGYAANGCSNTATATVNSAPTASVISAGPAYSIIASEGFDGAPLPAGWAQQNLSSPAGSATFPQYAVWYQGSISTGTVGTITAHSGADFRGASFHAGAGNATLSNWLFSPAYSIQNGDEITFWARSNGATSGFPDRLQVRFNPVNNGVNAGATATSVGDFTMLLQDINPSYSLTGFPDVWTQYTGTVSGLAAPTTGRFAFRYFVESGGPSGANSDNIGIDDVVIRRPLAGVCANTVSTISVAITGGVGPYTVVYTNGTTSTTYNGYTSGSPIQVSPSATTTYTLVSVTGANGCVGTGNSGSAVIVVTPPPSVTTPPANRTVCAGGNTTFTVTAAPATGNTYQWQVSTDNGGTYANVANGGVYSGATTATLTLTGVTTTMNGYRYRVVINGQCPPSPVTSAAATLTVNVPPTITTNPANRASCVGTTATFSVVATGNGATYQWQQSIDGGLTYTNITGGTSATLSLPGVTQSMNNNRYRVVVTVSPCTATVTSTAAVLTVNPLPVVSISTPDVELTPGQTATITATSTPAAISYAWTLNGSAIQGTTNTVTADINSLGTYVARATDANGCVGTSNALVIGGESSDRMWIYPNPSAGQFQVRYYHNGLVSERRVVTIYDSHGKRVVEQQYTLDNLNGPYLQMNFDLSKFGKGIYVVRIIDRFRSDKPVASGLISIQ